MKQKIKTISSIITLLLVLGVIPVTAAAGGFRFDFTLSSNQQSSGEVLSSTSGLFQPYVWPSDSNLSSTKTLTAWFTKSGTRVTSYRVINSNSQSGIGYLSGMRQYGTYHRLSGSPSQVGVRVSGTWEP